MRERYLSLFRHVLCRLEQLPQRKSSFVYQIGHYTEVDWALMHTAISLSVHT